MLNKTFEKAIKVIEIIETNGHRAYIVGGAVRDQLIGRKIGDIDITSSAKPQEIQQMFDKVIPVGIEHGTVIVRMEEESFEVTTFRVEGAYSDSRHPDQVKFVDQVEEDLARRDFTINAIAMDKQGNYVDPFNGIEGIQKRSIQTVGNPEERFQEDALRMLRALRFSSQLGFEIEQHTLSTLNDNAAAIEKIAIERITVELQKLFSGRYVENAIQLFLHVNLHQHLPILSELPKIDQLLEQITKPVYTFSELISIFHLFQPSIGLDRWMKEWKLSKQVKNNAHYLVEAITAIKRDKLTNWVVYCLPEQLDKPFVRVLSLLLPNEKLSVGQLKAIRSTLPITNRKDIAIKGNEIIPFFPNLKKGPWINQLLTDLEHAIVEGRLTNQKLELERWVKNWNPPDIN